MDHPENPADRSGQMDVQEAETWFQALAETTSAAIFVYQDHFLYANHAFEALTGYSRTELLRMTPAEIIHPDFRDELNTWTLDDLDGDKAPARHEAVLITRLGEERWLDYAATLISLEGRPAVLGTAFDITDRKTAEIALRESEERLSLAQQAAGVITWDWNLLTDQLMTADAGLESLGADPDKVPLTTEDFFTRFVHPEDRERLLEAIRKAIRKGQEYAVEHRYLDLGGRVRWLSERGRAIRDESGWVVRMIGISIDITEHKEAEIALRESNERLRLLVEQMPAVLWTTDEDLRFTSSVGAGLSGLGLKPNAVVGLKVGQYFAPEGPSTNAYKAHQKALNGESVSYEQVWGGNVYQSHVEPLRDANKGVVGCVGIALDVTAHRRAEEALLREREQAHVTLASINEGVIRTDEEGRIEYMNPAAERLTGVTLKEVRHRSLEEIYKVIDEVSGQPLLNPVEKALKEKRSVMLPGRRMLLARGGGEFSVRDSASPIWGPERQLLGAVLAFNDISAVRKMEREMAYLANHDGLTALLNRAAFERRLDQALEQSTLDGKPLALVQLDLAQFKVVNDTCGHLAGDEMLKGVARRLRGWAGDSHALARLGADEFSILLAGVTPEEARLEVHGLQELFRDYRFKWQDRTFDVRAHMGLVTAPSGDSASGLMIAADIACMLAKEQGRGSLHEYQADDEVLSERYREMHWIHRIHRALDEGSFRLYCQPIQPLKGKDPDGFLGEVLLRMVDEDGELVMPRSFLPAAERYRVISSIDRWVIKNSFALLAGGATLAGTRVERLAINVSGESLGDRAFLEYVVDQLETSGVEPRQVLLEITETAAIANLEGAMRFIAELQDRGVLFVLDDFGSGLSSFAYLANLPVNYLKIAGEFLSGIESTPMNRTLVRSIHQIGQELGLKTIAEGVETQSIYRVLQKINIDYAQGFWIARPIPLMPHGG